MASIDSIISDAKDYAGDLLKEARDLVNDANRIAEGRSFVNAQELAWQITPEPEDDFVNTNLPSPFSDVYTSPDAAGIEEIEFLEPYVLTLPEFPKPPEELDTSGLFDFERPHWDVPDFTTAAPNINTNLPFPIEPSLALPESPQASEDLFTVPTVVAPTFDDHMNGVVVEKVDVTGRIANEFTVTRAQLINAADSYAESWMVTHCPNYHAGMAALEERIASAMAGGSALNEAWEQAVYDRAMIRVNDENQRAQQALTADYARRGFPLPPGAVMGGLSRLRYEQSRNTADVSANIANERAKIELSHMQLGMQLSFNVRQHFSSAMQGYMQLVMTSNGLALEYAKEVGRWAAELFNQGIELYKLELARYQAEAQVYSVRLESAFAIIKVFEVEIEAEKLKIDVDRSAIALFEAKILSEQSKVELYNSQLQAIRSRMEGEAQKISVYETQVRAYAARVGAKSSEYDAYRAAIQGDMGRVEAYQATVQAFGARVQTTSTRVSAERDISQSIAEYNKSLIERRDGTIRKYLADVTAESARFDGTINGHKVALAQYQTRVEARLQLVTTRYEKDRLMLQGALAKVETNLKAQMKNVEGFIRSIVAQAQITQSGGKIIGDMGSSVLTTNNAIIIAEETL